MGHTKDAGRGLRVLIADDDPGIRDLFVDVLSRAGHRVDTAVDGPDVLQRVRDVDYDLVLQDLVFPPANGIALLRRVKDIRPALHVAVMTGFATVGKVVHAQRSGAFDFLEKPVDAVTLVELASRVSAIRRRSDERRRLVQQLALRQHEMGDLLRRLVALDRSESVEPRDRPAAVGPNPSATCEAVPGTLRTVERERILAALDEAEGNKKRAAQILGIHRSTLYTKLRRHGLDEAPGDTSDSARDDEAPIESAALVAST